jgi:hypothetical protein
MCVCVSERERERQRERDRERERESRRERLELPSKLVKHPPTHGWLLTVLLDWASLACQEPPLVAPDRQGSFPSSLSS